MGWDLHHPSSGVLMYFNVPPYNHYTFPQYNYCPCCGKPIGAQPMVGYPAYTGGQGVAPSGTVAIPTSQGLLGTCTGQIGQNEISNS